VRTIVIILACALLVGLVGCGKSEEPSEPKSTSPKSVSPEKAPAETECAACAKGKAGESVWCEDCNAGYVEGVKTGCKGCYQAKLGGPACAT
jgi:hypothetical protein